MDSVEIAVIKQEVPDRNASHIQSYIDSFNKELQGAADSAVTETEAGYEDLLSHDENGTYFVDQDGHYYFQPAPQPDSIDFPNSEIVTTENESIEDSAENQLVLGGSSTDEFQTVTLVPSKSETGEVTYMLIVQENENGDDDEQPPETDKDFAVYDFDEVLDEDREPQSDDSGREDVKFKIPKQKKVNRTPSAAHKCQYCDYRTHKRYLLTRHLKSHSEERPHKCNICERGFKTSASLHNHVNTHTGAKPHVCRYCEKGFTTSGALVIHRRYVHTKERPHKCHLCHYAATESSKLRNHLRIHTGEKPYQCPHCTYASPDTFKLKRHLRTHTGERPYVCTQCGQRFTQSNSLKIHRLRHNPEERPMFQCELCPTKCGRKTDLRIHVQKLHTTDKLFNCKRCGKTCADRYTYKMHVKTHTGEKCYKCDLCPYSSISQRHLESHTFIHTNEKPFACSQCDQSFRQAQLLKRHQNLYHNPTYVPPAPLAKNHQCLECGRQFRHKGNLIRHMALHDPDSRYKEMSVALKLGRQRKIRLVPGDQLSMPNTNQDHQMSVSVVSEEDEEYMDEEEEDMKVMMSDEARLINVTTDDSGQEYVVIEVVQVPDEDGEEGEEGGDIELDQITYVLPDQLEQLDSEEPMPEVDTKPYTNSNSQALALRTLKTEIDLETCFGFEEEEEEEE